MKYKLIIDSEAEEEIVARVRCPGKLTEEIENLVNSYTGNTSITVSDSDELTRLEFSDIECITVSERKVYAIDTKGQKHRVGQRLCDLEGRLPSYFIRINKSALANENCIIRFNTVYSGAVDAHFKCGYKEYVSRRCFADIKRRWNVK
jgi:DNA-binding LytR/AlgR family response regulator